MWRRGRNGFSGGLEVMRLRFVSVEMFFEAVQTLWVAVLFEMIQTIVVVLARDLIFVAQIA